MSIAAAFIIGEIFTAGFFLLWFGVGAAVAGILAILGFGMAWQWGAFLLMASVLFAVSRRFAERFTKKQPLGIGADRYIGEKGVVLEEIDTIKNTGLVQIRNENWRADSDTGDIIPAGKKVEVIKVVGTHLVVRILSEGG
ncbi:MAG: NfeD family protein [Candidatus Brocadia sp. AMX2]|nr:MAG: NfeD family protein [Candidatus Brocadia sp. AMX2]MBC6932731.1 NfeD family protein [Candidatus Brocadia sp.]MBL1169943.1 NfeD family protein [Candidatus Brocadia sp. AMX1]MCE7867102.1 NfeD family protein [Candidatus Brocadia sp. AMX2]MCQ3917720.1 NfeD family protein [Candidatus Brocadia sp.]